ncbi:CheR family methyltransferase [Mongoliimonas terrestris]|uniref:CheR family methyltransferase n=1 Tax=Mongoliimonas terrestris TaxID=1709001 RepID=UPI0009494EED|nr:protein-glutamate O-methyltransferase CheR [Mongoliimonas terrestris]
MSGGGGGIGGADRPVQPDHAAGSREAGFPALKRLIIGRTGHHYYEDKDALLAERVGARLKATGISDLGTYAARLADPADGPAEWAALVAEITIGETFFFRFAEQFAALRDVILPDILARNAGTQRLRVWSAGAATGAEAYSLAILVRDLLGDAAADWRLSIVGTDINETFLAKARAGVFNGWALRSLGPDERARWFDPGPGPGRFTLKRRYAALVRFEPHNLLHLLDGTSPLQFSDFDLVLCRNVLIYFHPDTVAALVQALGRTLADAGWLLLGHAEMNPAAAGTVTAVDVNGTLVFRRADTAAAPPRTAAVSPAASPPFHPPAFEPLALDPPAPAARPPLAPPVLAATPAEALAASALAMAGAAGIRALDGADGATLLAAARASADAGDLAAAREACRTGQRDWPDTPAFHHLEGLVERAAGHLEAAERAFRRTLFLTRDFAMAHYHLGLTLLDAGRPADGRRSIANAARLAAAAPADALLPDGDGLTAGGLAALARHMLDRPPGHAPSAGPASGGLPAAKPTLGGLPAPGPTFGGLPAPSPTLGGLPAPGPTLGGLPAAGGATRRRGRRP